MILIIGGAHQGKLEYALRHFGLTKADTAYDFAGAETKPLFSGLHAAVRRALEAGEDPALAMERVLEKNPSVVVLCDEVGCGVVPMDAGEREWREAVGRLCCSLAARAETVERVFCGLPMTLSPR